MADYTLSVNIKGDAEEFKAALRAAEKAVDGFNTQTSSLQKKLSSIGSSFQNFGKKISSVGSTLTNKITKPAIAATSAVAGITLVKGWNRLTGIDDARAKLTALGHSAEDVEEIMDSALSAVKGTSYGLDEAATTAANAVAAGIAPGKELTEYLTMTADAAAIAGISMSEMGSIINKVQTGQTAYTEELEMFADRGLPIYQWIAEEAGVAASEVKGLASDGKISSEMLFNAIQKNIGGAAKTIGEESFTAALANIGASIGRIGANFLDAGSSGGGFFSQMKPLLTEFNEKLGTVEEKAADLGAKFGEAFANAVNCIRDLKAKFDELPQSVQKAITTTAGIGGAVAVGIGPAMKVIGGVSSLFGEVMFSVSDLAGKLASLGGAFLKIVTFANPVVSIAAILITLFAGLFATNEEFRNSVITLVSALGEALAPILSSIMEIIVQVAEVIGSVVMTILNELAPVITQIITLVSGIIVALTPLISTIVEFLTPIIQAIITLIQTIVLPIITAIITAVGWLVEKIVAFITPIVEFIGGVINAIVEILAVFKETVGEVWDWIKEKLGAFSDFLANIFVKDWSEAFGFIGDIMNGLFKNISNIWESIKKIFSGIVDFIAGIFTGNWKRAWNGIKNIFSGIWGGLEAIVKAPINAIISLINGAIGGINKISVDIPDWVPAFGGKHIGFNIAKIPYLKHGTDDWQGGFAYMNEGGRGELVNLPNGSQVIPHDISVKYAREVARTNTLTGNIVDIESILDGVVINVYSQTNVDGTPLLQKAADYTVERIARQQRSSMRMKGQMA